ncbi:hypothetical protein B0T17DRAFT_511276 [Bombardia bombarda]|uniref:Uncharacterized protein n=1 Tax=Bombardia bombarda TaxID=252184 RepID=A0AA39WCJ6_9PEZI|nr:hypothetical protein B0T17DRAFT_511276 [Bombardia bombarda]
MRQQRTLPHRQDTASPRQDNRSATLSSQRGLRRTPHFQPSPSPRPFETQHRIHLEAATVGISPRPLFSVAGGSGDIGQIPRRQLSQDLSGGSEQVNTPTPSSPQRFSSSLAERPEPRLPGRLSDQTRSAILWALEEALRYPNPFSPDIIEENASMADLLGGGSGPATTNGNGASSSRPTAPSAQTGSPQQVIRGPRAIMRERLEREARQRAEREQMERVRAEEEARLHDESRRRRSSAAGATSGGGEIPTDPATQRRQQRAQESQGAPRIQPQIPSTSQQQQQQQQKQQQQQQDPAIPPPLRPTRVPTSTQAPPGFPAATQPGVSAPPPAQAGEPSTQGPSTSRVKNSFPHAFERWEALSAHWEGMTSFWIRKLQENTEELSQNPISAQLSRQVGDLSAAGANLFHAVVELQRLRASSERKFQRWFFETRSELERNQEVHATMEGRLEEERRSRADAIRDAVNHERENSTTQKLLQEMRRELTISKEEARRAWEELGRREQEERDRTISLQQGHPTIVGGVQVVPMTQGVPIRALSTRNPRTQAQADTSEYAAAQAPHYPEYTQAPPVQGGTTSAGGPSGSYYQGQQQQEHGVHETGSYGAQSEAAYSEGEYVIDGQGNFVRDAHGNKIPFYSPPNSPQRGARESDDGTDEYETPASQGIPTTNYPPSSSQWAATYSSPPNILVRAMLRLAGSKCLGIITPRDSAMSSRRMMSAAEPR